MMKVLTTQSGKSADTMTKDGPELPGVLLAKMAQAQQDASPGTFIKSDDAGSLSCSCPETSPRDHYMVENSGYNLRKVSSATEEGPRICNAEPLAIYLNEDANKSTDCMKTASFRNNYMPRGEEMTSDVVTRAASSNSPTVSTSSGTPSAFLGKVVEEFETGLDHPTPGSACSTASVLSTTTAAMGNNPFTKSCCGEESRPEFMVNENGSTCGRRVCNCTTESYNYVVNGNNDMEICGSDIVEDQREQDFSTTTAGCTGAAVVVEQVVVEQDNEGLHMHQLHKEVNCSQRGRLESACSSTRATRSSSFSSKLHLDEHDGPHKREEVIFNDDDHGRKRGPSKRSGDRWRTSRHRNHYERKSCRVRREEQHNGQCEFENSSDRRGKSPTPRRNFRSRDRRRAETKHHDRGVEHKQRDHDEKRVRISSAGGDRKATNTGDFILRPSSFRGQDNCRSGKGDLRKQDSSATQHAAASSSCSKNDKGTNSKGKGKGKKRSGVVATNCKNNTGSKMTSACNGTQSCQSEPNKPKSASVLVTRLNPLTSPDNLRDFMHRSGFGRVKDVYIPLEYKADPPKPKGYGFVEFVHADDAEFCIGKMRKAFENEEDNLNILDGQALKVDVAKADRKKKEVMFAKTGVE
ncbi:unnamed protein product [Amoebophrya sp. A120]|nr:unnamed protein product [Amoebophrya sp. A120]|eukprot:GSA120T00009252001.1